MRYVVLVEGRYYNLLCILVIRRRGMLLRLCLYLPDIGGVKGFVFYLSLLVIVVILCIFVLFGDVSSQKIEYFPSACTEPPVWDPVYVLQQDTTGKDLA